MSNALWLVAGCLITAAVSLLIWRRNCKRQRKRLMGLAAYLEATSSGRESILIRTEDEFSLLEDELYKTVSELRAAREKAQRERRQQAENLADISHQLKTPLTSMSLMTQLLSADASAEQSEYIARLDSQIKRLIWLTDSLLAMSRLDAGSVEFTPVSMTAGECAAQAAEPMEQLLRERAQTLAIEGDGIPISCDPHWTAEALLNLIKNCSEHTPPGGQIFVKAASTPLYLQITVEDTGSGFDPAEIPMLFRRFFRGKDSGKDSIGIGLALCKAIVEGQGGVIRAENRPQGGARFIIRFYP